MLCCHYEVMSLERLGKALVDQTSFCTELYWHSFFLMVSVKFPTSIVSVCVCVPVGKGGGINYSPFPRNTITRKELSDSLIPGQQEHQDACRCNSFFLFWKWVEEMVGYWPLCVTAGKGLDYIAEGPEQGKNICLMTWWSCWIDDQKTSEPNTNIIQERKGVSIEGYVHKRFGILELSLAMF